jgi:NAD(P)-dependent dehydrogenase (short-subunit alcohol dehydrogenase family)
MATVLITGANKGIGLQLTRLYAEAGNKVIACCRDASGAADLNALAAEHDVDVRQVTVGDGDSVANLAKDLQGVTIDVLINNAGMAGPSFDQQTALNMDFDGWAEAFNVNAMAPVRVMQALIENLRAADAAKIMTVTSQYGAMSFEMPMAYAYSTTKASVNKFMKMAALELGKEGISVGLVHPGWVQTDMGGPQADLTPTESATGIVGVIDKLSADSNGGFWKWDGEVHAW